MDYSIPITTLHDWFLPVIISSKRYAIKQTLHSIMESQNIDIGSLNLPNLDLDESPSSASPRNAPSDPSSSGDHSTGSNAFKVECQDSGDADIPNKRARQLKVPSETETAIEPDALPEILKVVRIGECLVVTIGDLDGSPSSASPRNAPSGPSSSGDHSTGSNAFKVECQDSGDADIPNKRARRPKVPSETETAIEPDALPEILKVVRFGECLVVTTKIQL